MDNSAILFSVIIPTCDRVELLNTCLSQVSHEKQSFIGLFEIIVTDDSADNTAKDMIEFENIRVIWVNGPGKGPAANRNNGARYAKGEWLVFIDDDCVPSTGLLQSYFHAIASNKNIEVFEGKIYSDFCKTRLDEEAPLNLKGGFLWSCNFAIKRTLFERLNGFNEAFPYPAMEDVEFNDRLKLVASTVFVSEAAVMHPWRIVKNPSKKWEKAYASHKIYYTINPAALKKITPSSFTYRILTSFISQTLPGVFRYKGKGIYYALLYHVFQIKILIYSLKNNKS